MKFSSVYRSCFAPSAPENPLFYAAGKNSEDFVRSLSQISSFLEPKRKYWGFWAQAGRFLLFYEAKILEISPRIWIYIKNIKKFHKISSKTSNADFSAFENLILINFFEHFSLRGLEIQKIRLRPEIRSIFYLRINMIWWISGHQGDNGGIP